MNSDNIPKIPLGLQMALAHNVPAMQAFLCMRDSEQDEFIEKSKQLKTKREIQALVDSLPETHFM